MIKLRTFASPEELVEAAAARIREHLEQPGSLMLSGGSTPYVIYRKLAGSGCPVHAGRSLFLSDERLVPFDSPDSNTGNLLPMLKAMDCEDRFIRVDTTLSGREAAARYARQLEPLTNIDLGLLGMGADGHTAGFFTLEAAGMKSGPLTLHTRRPDGMEGVSVTPALFLRAKSILLLVPGEAKRAIITRLLERPAGIPAGVALSDHPAVELWTDLADLRQTRAASPF